MDHWLIRTATNIIAGPYLGDQVRKLIQDGELHYQDEICQANGYWIYLHEREEVKQLLGIDVPFPDDEDEVTKTQIGTDPDILSYRPDTGSPDSDFGHGGMGEGPLDADQMELAEPAPDDDLTTTFIRRPFRDFQPKHKTAVVNQPLKVEAKGESFVVGDSRRVERSRLFQAVIIVLIFVAAGLLYAVFRLLRA